MKKGAKKRISARRLWTINPKTRVTRSGKIYSRPRVKREAAKNAKYG